MNNIWKDISRVKYLANNYFVNAYIFLDCENPQDVGNGFCDDYNNKPECNYDSGDCCGSCVNKQYCSTCACLDGGSGNGKADSLIGNGYCDDGLNNTECQFDGDDCNSSGKI